MQLSNAAYADPFVKVVITGAKLKKVLKSDDGPLAEELLRTVLEIERRAKSNAPVDTGRLQNSISSGLEDNVEGLAGVVGTDVDYAPFVEFGTQRMPPRPFLTSAAYDVLGGP